MLSRAFDGFGVGDGARQGFRDGQTCVLKD